MTWFHRDGSECTRKVTPTKRADTAVYESRSACSRCGGAGGFTEKIIRLDTDQKWSRYAARSIVIGHDEHGNHIKYVGSGSYPGEGETLAATATVVEHSEYRGQKQTTLQRPRFTEVKQHTEVA
jgi:hypothetical protein